MKSNKIYYFSALTAVLLWSCSLITTKIAYTTFPPLTLGAVRSLIAAAVLYAVIKISGKGEKMERCDLKYFIFIGLFGVTLYFAFQNIGIDYTTASSAALISGAYPAITALIEFVVLKSLPSKRKALGLAVALGGTYLLSTTGGGSASNPVLGNVLLIVAGVVFAIYNLITKKIGDKYTPITITFYQMAFGGVFFIPIALFEYRQWQVPTVASISATLFLAVCCSVIAFILYNFGLKKLSASSITALINVMPVCGLILGIVFMKDPILVRQLIGGAIVLIGVTLSSD